MQKYIVSVFAYSSIALIVLTHGNDSNSKNKENSFAILDAADDLIERASVLLQNCAGSCANSHVCGQKIKSSTFLEVAREMISKAKKTHPICTYPETEEPETTQSITTQSTIPKYIITQYTTKQPTHYPRDCTEELQHGQKVSGVYTIFPNSTLFPNRSLQVFCDMDTDGRGWTVVQRRGNFTPQEDFYRDWKDYKNGFGNITKDFWLGNDNLFVLSNQRKYKIRFDLVSAEGQKRYAEYESFNIEDENANYKLHITGYRGDAGDAMDHNKEGLFSTKDRDNDKSPTDSCAERLRGGWWYNVCSYSNPNGEYKPGVDDCKSLHWSHWKMCAGLASTEIKIKPI